MEAFATPERIKKWRRIPLYFTYLYRFPNSSIHIKKRRTLYLFHLKLFYTFDHFTQKFPLNTTNRIRYGRWQAKTQSFACKALTKRAVYHGHYWCRTLFHCPPLDINHFWVKFYPNRNLHLLECFLPGTNHQSGYSSWKVRCRGKKCQKNRGSLPPSPCSRSPTLSSGSLRQMTRASRAEAKWLPR